MMNGVIIYFTWQIFRTIRLAGPNKLTEKQVIEEPEHDRLNPEHKQENQGPNQFPINE
jgi:hypothetical protein